MASATTNIIVSRRGERRRLEDIATAPRDAGGVDDVLAAALHQVGHHEVEADDGVHGRGLQVVRTRLRKRGFGRAGAQVQRENQHEGEDGQVPTEEVLQRHAEETAALLPDPPLRDGRCHRIHRQIPQHHDEGADQRRDERLRRRRRRASRRRQARWPAPTTGSRRRGKQVRSSAARSRASGRVRRCSDRGRTGSRWRRRCSRGRC